MNTIEFQNKKYKVRRIELPEIGSILVSTTKLNTQLLNYSGGYISDEAASIDENIYYFVDENEIEFNDEELVDLLTSEVK